MTDKMVWNNEKQPRVRFAPSPTGFLHIGGVRTALFNFLFAKKNGGLYYLRIDDTDKERSKKEYEEEIIAGFQKLGLLWDNKEIIRQSERLILYKKYLEKLLTEDKAYISNETNVKEGERAEVIRLRNPNKKIEFEDLVRGKVVFDTSELGDFVIAKSLDEPIYHFASVIDDLEMAITHVIRAEEHLSNTPRQILIQEAVGAESPIYAHVPLILAADRSKLSKRQGAVTLKEFLEQGYLPEGILNYLALLGWHPADNQEIFSLSELIEAFDLNRVQKGGAIWNTEKLNWVNREHLNKIPNLQIVIADKIKEVLRLGENKETEIILEKIAPIVLERISKFGDIKEMADRGELAYFFQAPEYPKEMLFWKKDKDSSRTYERLVKVREILGGEASLGGFASKYKNELLALAEKEGRGEVLWPLRVALSGLEKSPDPFVLLKILGEKEALLRIDKAINILV